MNVSSRHVQFSLASILLVTALIAVCLAVLRVTTLGGTFALVVSALALLRNALVGRACHERIATIRDKLELFLESVSVVLLGLVAAIVGFSLSLVVLSLLGVLLVGYHVLHPLPLLVGAVGFGVCIAWPIGAFVFTFLKLTFPVR